MVFELLSARGLEFELTSRVPVEELRTETIINNSLDPFGRNIETIAKTIFWLKTRLGLLIMSRYGLRDKVIDYSGIIPDYEGQGRNGRVQLFATESQIFEITLLPKSKTRYRNNTQREPLFRHDQYYPELRLADHETSALLITPLGVN